MISLFILYAIAAPAVAQLDAGLVAWFSFDQPGNLGDDAAGGHHATSLVGVTSINGISSPAAHFDQGYLQLPDDDELNLLAGDFTLSALVRSDALTNRNWFTKASVTEHRYGLGASHVGGLWGLGFNGLGKALTTQPFLDGFWHHVVGIKRGSTAELWLDGVLMASAPIGPLFPDDGAFAIGRDGECCESFDGDMDEVKIWNRALTPTEIAEEARPVAPMASMEILFYVSDEAGDLDIWMMSPDDPQSREPFLVRPGTQDHPWLSHDGRFLAFSDSSSGTTQIKVRDLVTSEERTLPDLGDVANVAWNAMNSSLISDPGGCSVPGAFDYPLVGGGSLLFLESGRMTVFDVDPATGKVYYTVDPCSSSRIQIRVWDPATNTKTTLLSDDSRSEGHGDLSADGQWLIYTKSLVGFSPPHRIYLLGTDGTPEIPISSHPSSTVNDITPRFSPDGETVVFARREVGNPYDLWLVSKDGSDPRPLLEGDFTARHPTWGRVPLYGGSCAAPDAGGCCRSSFENEPGPFTISKLGDATVAAAVLERGELHVSGTGSSLYHGEANGAFVHRQVRGDFRIEVDITGVPIDQGGTYRKGALMARGSLAADAPQVMVEIVPHHPLGGPALQFNFRNEHGHAEALASTQTGIQLPVRLAIQRLGNMFEVSYSEDDGETWIHGGGSQGSIEIDMGTETQVGMAVASYSSQPLTVSFDDFALCQPIGNAVAPDFLPCVDGPVDLVYLLDLSDSMARAHGAPDSLMSKLEAGRQAVLAVHEFVAARGDGSRAALITSVGVRNDPGANRSASATVSVGLTDNFAAVADALSELQLPVLDPYRPATTTPTAIALGAVRQLLVEEGIADRPAVVLWVTDGLPDIDSRGRGSRQYEEDAVAIIEVRRDLGGFRSPPEVAWSGGFDEEIDTFDGQVLADSMVAAQALRNSIGDLRILVIEPRGSATNPPILPQGLLDYTTHISQGSLFGAADPAGLLDQVPSLLKAIACDQDGPGFIEGQLWRDDNRDGSREPGEPPLSGVSIELWQGGLLQTTTSDDAGNYRFTGVASSSAVEIRVDATTLPRDATEPTFDSDGVATAHSTQVLPLSWSRVVADFGYGTPQASPIFGCELDDFDAEALDPAWRFGQIGDADLGSLSLSGGRLLVTGSGSSLYAGPDASFFVHRSIAGSFRLEADLVEIPVDQGGTYRKTGLMARRGLNAEDSRLMIQFSPDYGGRTALQFRYRVEAGGDGSQFLGADVFDVQLPVRLALERSGDTYQVFYSLDGGDSWRQPSGALAGTVDLDLGGSPHVGLNVVSYDQDDAMTAAYSELLLCGPEDDPCGDDDPFGQMSHLRLLDGVVAGQMVSPAQRRVVVAAGAGITGFFEVEISSAWPSNAVMALGWTPTWGDHQASHVSLGGLELRFRVSDAW